jgi:hypothetical protein
MASSSYLVYPLFIFGDTMLSRATTFGDDDGLNSAIRS